MLFWGEFGISLGNYLVRNYLVRCWEYIRRIGQYLCQKAVIFRLKTAYNFNKIWMYFLRLGKFWGQFGKGLSVVVTVVDDGKLWIWIFILIGLK